jgi:hypothetical protein
MTLLAATYDVLSGAQTSPKCSLAKLEKAVFDGFDGLYAQAKNQRSVGEIDSIISTVLSDPEIATV